VKKTLYTLNIGNYEPAVCALTYPLLRRYAEKIGADFHIINERRFPGLPIPCEKLQIYDLARQRGDDWAIYIDSDALIHPDTMDFTEVLPRDTVMHNGVDFAPCRFVYDDYFRRDGRHIASCNWFTVASAWCLDLWKPLDDLTLDDAVSRLRPILSESGREPSHFLDDFILSRNIAHFGLKCTTFRDMLAKIGQVDASFLWHEYTLSAAQKLAMIKKVLHHWTGGAFQE
jgi:hypothetical protein